jgi:uncharacterized protein (DUF488 family)
MEVWTVGHSTRPLGAFLELLQRHRIEAIADVRRFPASRAHPEYNANPLGESLEAAGIAYRGLLGLGGRRRPLADGPCTAWRNPSFHGYAQHMQSEEFASGLAELTDLSGGLRTALLCSEALWWRCHRRLIADALVSLGLGVWHIGERGAEPHRLLSPARLLRGRLTYAPLPAAG